MTACSFVFPRGARSLAWLAACSLVFAACGGSGGSSGGGAETLGFLTADARGIAHSVPPADPSGAAGPLQTAADAAGAGADLAREIEEADVYALDGDRLVIANPYRGLAIVDLAQRRIAGRLAFAGTPIEVYAEGTRALVVVSDYQYGGALLDVSLADPNAPVLRASVPLSVQPRTSRLVGDHLVVVGTGSEGDAVLSFHVAATLTSADELALPARVDFLHATNSLLFLASQELAQSVVRLVDVSDPTGQLALRGSLSVAGAVRGDDKLDFQAGTLRVVTHDTSAQWLSHLYTADVSNPDAPFVRGELELGYGEQLFATRFTESKGYIVTFEQVDPLWVVDLADPDHPVVAGELVVPGWSTQIVALPGRLLALGVDPANGWRTTVSLFDVSDDTTPSLITRVDLGQGWSEASHDRKAFNVFPEAGLAFVPILYNEPRTAVLDFTVNTLTQRGWIDTRDRGLRSFPHGSDVCTITPTAVLLSKQQDLADTTTLVLAENVVDSGRIGVPGAGRKLDLVNDNGFTKVGGVSLPFAPERLFTHGRTAAVLGSDEIGRAAYVVDYGVTPTRVSPRIDLGAFTFVPYATGDASLALWAGPLASGNVAEALQTNGGRLVLRGTPVGHADLEIGTGAERDAFVVVDMTTGTVESRITIRGAVTTGAALDGEMLAFTLGSDAGYDASQRPLVRHNFRRVDLATLAVTSDTSVPGALLAMSGDRVWTVEDVWNAGWSVRTNVVAAQLRPTRAFVLDREQLPQGAFDLRVAGSTLYYTVSDGLTYGPVIAAGSAPWLPSTEIRVLRLGAVLQPGPVIASGGGFDALLLAEADGALVVHDGVRVERFDVTGASAVSQWSRDIGVFPRIAHADGPGSYVLALGFSGTAHVP